MARWPVLALATALCFGCDDGGGGDEATGGAAPAGGAMGGGDAPAGGEAPTGGDAPAPDMGVPPAPTACLNEDGDLAEAYTGEPLPGASDLRTDVDVDGDGTPELLIELHVGGGVRFDALTRDTREAAGGFTLAGVDDADLMPGHWPSAAVVSPPAAGWVLWTRAGDAHGLAVVSGDSVSRTMTLSGPALRVQSVQVGEDMWRILVDLADGGCAVYDPAAEAPLYEDANCALRPAWDVDGDGTIDLARDAVGLEGRGALLSGADLSALATAELPVMLGFVPITFLADPVPPGEMQLRQEMVEPDEADPMPVPRGPELLGARIEDRLHASFLNPDDLVELGAVTPQAGHFERLQMHWTGSAHRLWVQFKRAADSNLWHVTGYLASDFVQRQEQHGPFEHVTWRLGPDLDGDGVGEMEIRGGPEADFKNAPVIYARLDDGVEVYRVEPDRSARMDAVWMRADGPSVPADLDGCAGEERILIRTGTGTRDGRTPTRVTIVDGEGAQLWRSEPYEGWLHVLRAADLDGDGAAELVELRGETPDAATLRIWSAVP
jgi:hypothetical protein